MKVGSLNFVVEQKEFLICNQHTISLKISLVDSKLPNKSPPYKLC